MSDPGRTTDRGVPGNGGGSGVDSSASYTAGSGEDPPTTAYDLPVVRSMIDIIDALVVVVATDGTIRLWNRRCEDASGVPLAGMAGRPLWELLRLRSHFRVDAETAFARLIGGEESRIAFHSHWTRADGRRVRIAWTAELVSPANRPALVVASGREVTRGRVVRRLQEAENKFEVLLDLLPEAVAVHQGGRAVFANQAAARLYGFSDPRELVGLDVFELVAPDLREAGRKRTAQMVETNSVIPISEWRHVKRDGTEIDVEVGAAPFMLDGRPAVIVVSRDITARKQAEAARADREARLRAIFDESPMGMMLIDRAWHTLESNDRLRSLLGFSAEELATRTVPDFIHADHRASCERNLRQLFAGRIPSFSLEGICIAKDGSEIWTRCHLSLVRGAGEQPELAVGVVEDIRQEKLLEAQVSQASKMEALGRLAGGVAHDFNNLLTVVNGYSEMLIESLAGDERAADAQEIKRAGTRGSELTSQLLAFGRRGPQRLEPLDLNGRIAALVPMLRRLLGEDIELKVELDQRVGILEADPSQLDQVVMNLVVNARDAMPNGGVLRLTTVRTAGPTLGTPQEASPEEELRGWVRLSVADSGLGMGPDVIDHIFEPFFTTKERGQGTGLGLAIVYSAVERMKGRIRVDSALGVGSLFRVELPLADPVELGEAAGDETGGATGNERILLVEDEAPVREFCRRALEKGGYRVVASGPAEAVERARSMGDGLDILVTDVVMPGLDGPSVAAILRGARPDLPVLFISGYPRDREDQISEPLADGFVLTKPFAARELCDAVRRTLERAAQPT